MAHCLTYANHTELSFPMPDRGNKTMNMFYLKCERELAKNWQYILRNLPFGLTHPFNMWAARWNSRESKQARAARITSCSSFSRSKSWLWTTLGYNGAWITWEIRFGIVETIGCVKSWVGTDEWSGNETGGWAWGDWDLVGVDVENVESLVEITLCWRLWLVEIDR